MMVHLDQNLFEAGRAAVALSENFTFMEQQFQYMVEILPSFNIRYERLDVLLCNSENGAGVWYIIDGGSRANKSGGTWKH